ncbi:MAG: VOC family protein [Alphaproteobacteria bacterium]|nr:VOC family protein [Alphaproteobacteria bacterium]
MIRGIDHIELIVRDVEAFVAFFEKLGFELMTRTKHHGASAELRVPGADGTIFEIHEVGGEEVIGINHIALRVDDAEAAYAQFQKDGVPFTRGPKPIAATGRTTVELRDPDGWRLQLVDAKRDAPAS